MFRKIAFTIVAAASLSFAALAPASAGHGGGGGGHGGGHGGGMHMGGHGGGHGGYFRHGRFSGAAPATSSVAAATGPSGPMLDRSASMFARTISDPRENARRVEPAGCILIPNNC